MKKTQTRRDFVRSTGALAAGTFLSPALIAGIRDSSTDIRSLFEANREDALDLTVRVFENAFSKR